MKTLTAVKLQKTDANPGEVIKNKLFIGGVGTAYNLKVLQDYKITHILTCANKIKPRFEGQFVYKTVAALDSEECDIKQYFEEATTWLKEVFSEKLSPDSEDPKDNRVLIHCFAGKSRATTMTLAYLMKEKQISLQDGYEMI